MVKCWGPPAGPNFGGGWARSRVMALRSGCAAAATVAAVLRDSAELPQAAIVMPPVTISKTAVMTSQQLAATVSAML